MARESGVRRLLLTHFSARYSFDTSDLEREARQVFPNVTAARDGTEIDVPYAERGAGDAGRGSESASRSPRPAPLGQPSDP